MSKQTVAQLYYRTLLLLLSRFSRVWLCATPQTAAHQAPPSLGFSRQEHWSGLPLNLCVTIPQLFFLVTYYFYSSHIHNTLIFWKYSPKLLIHYSISLRLEFWEGNRQEDQGSPNGGNSLQVSDIFISLKWQEETNMIFFSSLYKFKRRFLLKYCVTIITPGFTEVNYSQTLS